MLSDYQRRQVWEGMLSAEIRANYFADLSRMYRLRQRIATWAVLLLSSGAAAVVLRGGLPTDIGRLVGAALPLLATAVSLYLIVADNPKAAVDSADLHSRWNRLTHEYEALWTDVYADDAEDRLRDLVKKGEEVSDTGVRAAFPNREKTMLKWQNHVEKHRLVHAQ